MSARDRSIAGALEAWFRAHARDLPWRTFGRRDPYGSLVAECMLQQTQVSRVLEKYGPFIARFPDAHALAQADEEAVLALWSGLGYYSRARRLHSAVRTIVDEHGGEVPSDVGALRTLPGIGRYSAGAIASIVYGEREPIVDGNVQRVLVRLEGRPLRLGARDTERWAWERAAELVGACEDPGVFNEGLMELGATVCTPRGPLCEGCPLRTRCAAYRRGQQEDLPLPKERATRREVWHALALEVIDGRVLLVKRPATGLWASLWAPPGLERDRGAPTAEDLMDALGADDADFQSGFRYETTHRIVRFELYRARGVAAPSDARWCTSAEAEELAISNAHRRALARVFRADPEAKKAR